MRRFHAAAFLALSASCGRAPAAPAAPPFAFEEVAAAAGLDARLTCGAQLAKTTILEVNGNGAALADLDGDADLDLVLVDGSTSAAWLAGESVTHLLFRNDGGADGALRLSRVLHESGLSMSGWPTGVAVGDVDGDGRPDLLVGGMGEDALFLNRSEPQGPLRFEKEALPGRSSPLEWTTSVALGDGDGDGHLDAYLARYLTLDPGQPPLGRVGDLPCRFEGHPVLCGPHGLPPQADVYLRGEPAGAEGARFCVATGAAGLDRTPPAYGLGVLFADLDQDGWLDLYLANDSVDNVLWHNRGDGTFEDVSLRSGAATDAAGRAQAGMGVDAGDFDRDGDLDLVVTNFSGESNAVYRQEGRLSFRDISAVAGVATVSRPLLGWGVHLADFDGDGWLDLFYANGHVFREADRPGTGTSYAQPLVLQRGGPSGAFGPPSFPDSAPRAARASVRGDLDGDGDQDLVVLLLDGAPLLYVNGHDRPDRQLLVSLTAGPLAEGRLPPGGRDAFGATLVLSTDGGTLVRQKVSASGFQGSNDARLHFALDGEVRAAEVLWPGGEREALAPAAFGGGRHLSVVRGQGVVAWTPLEIAP